MTDWTDRLSDYLDGDMSGDELMALEAALQGDAELRAVLEELRVVREAAGSLPSRNPADDLWPGIQARIERGESAGVVSLAYVCRKAERGRITEKVAGRR